MTNQESFRDIAHDERKDEGVITKQNKLLRPHLLNMRNNYRKVIVLLVMILLAFSAVAFFGCVPPHPDSFDRVVEGDFVVLNYKTEKYPELNYVHIEGLSEVGKQKQIIIVPEFLLGKRVDGFVHGQGVTDPYWRSQRLEKVFILAKINRSGWDGKSAISNEPGFCPNLKKIIIIKQKTELSINDPCYYSRRWFENYKQPPDLPFLVNPLIGRGRANIAYYWNYDNAPNDNYFWLDDVDYGTKIAFIPPAPVCNGYTFGGWYKEATCDTKWDFDTDTLPTEKRDNENKLVYQETILYAKWTAI